MMCHSDLRTRIFIIHFLSRDLTKNTLGGGFRMGNTCKSMADSCQCMAKTTTIL